MTNGGASSNAYRIKMEALEAAKTPTRMPSWGGIGGLTVTSLDKGFACYYNHKPGDLPRTLVIRTLVILA